MYTNQYVVTVPGIRRMYISQYLVTVPVTGPGLEECIQVSTWLRCRLRCRDLKNVYKSVRGYGAGNKKNVYKSVRGYGVGYGAGTRRMYTSQYVVTVPVTVRD